MIEVSAAINPVSISGQCHARQDIEACIAEVVRSLVVLQPNFTAKTATLTFDQAMESRSLGLDEPLVASLNRITDRQVVRQWFLYTRNRAQAASADSVQVRIESGAGEAEAQLPRDLVEHCTHWISFSGTPLFRCGELRVHTGTAAPFFKKKNAEKGDTVRRWLPRYEASSKHRVDEYVTRHGVVSPMDLKDEDAERVLSHSIKHSDDLRYGLLRSTFYAFRLTRVDNEQAVFHGYIVESHEIPDGIEGVLRPQDRKQ